MCMSRLRNFVIRLFRAETISMCLIWRELGYGLGLGVWVVFVITVSLNLTISLIKTLTVILL